MDGPLSEPPPDRRIPLAGPVNFRDLGGYPAGDGQMVRWRRLFRSDSLGPVGHDDARVITEELGLVTIVDLRSASEVRREGRGALADAPLDYHHLPILGVDVDSEALASISVRALYLGMLHASAARIAEILTVVAEARAQPVVFHCVAGKDRTGIVAAVLLALLGVSDDDIIADYVLTAEVMPVMLERYSHRGRQRSGRAALPSPLLRAEAATMHDLLAVVRETYGSAAGYVRSGGATDYVVTALQSTLLTSAGDGGS